MIKQKEIKTITDFDKFSNMNSKCCELIIDLTAKQKEEEISHYDYYNARHIYNNERLKLLDYISENFYKVKNKVVCIDLYIPNERIPKQIFKHIYKFYKKAKNIECNVKIKHEYHSIVNEYPIFKKVCWNLNTIIKANNEINKVCKFIKSNNFSPLEALAYVHKYVSTIADYNFSDNTFNPRHDQYFAGAFMVIPEIVCAGYSSLMKEIIDNLNMPELQCELVNLDLKRPEKEYNEQHQRCLIKIKYDKYGINQTVFDDPTWDNKIDSISSKYAFFAMSNDCDSSLKNKLWEYRKIYKCNLIGSKSLSEVVEFDKSKYLYNKSINKIDQKMIESVIISVMMKANKKAQNRDIYNALKLIVKESFKNQISTKYIGNFIQSKPITTIKEIEKNCNNQSELEENSLQKNN